jgi:hypothetical protein
MRNTVLVASPQHSILQVFHKRSYYVDRYVRMTGIRRTGIVFVLKSLFIGEQGVSGGELHTGNTLRTATPLFALLPFASASSGVVHTCIQGPLISPITSHLVSLVFVGSLAGWLSKLRASSATKLKPKTSNFRKIKSEVRKDPRS